MRVVRKRTATVVHQVRGTRGRSRQGSSGRGIPTTTLGCRLRPAATVGLRRGVRSSIVTSTIGRWLGAVSAGGLGKDPNVHIRGGSQAFWDIVTRLVALEATPPASTCTTRRRAPARRRRGRRRHISRRWIGKHPTYRGNGNLLTCPKRHDT